MATGFIHDERFLVHDTRAGHPERPDRLRAIEGELRRRGLLDRLTTLAFDKADMESILAVHSEVYVNRLRRACETGLPFIDCVDSAICPASFEVALLAAGGVVAACDAIMTGGVRNAFCAIRPPGHHAERDRSMGFCLFNNVAVAARHLQRVHGMKRVLIFDWDVHHGNGTQHLFDDDPSVFYASIHEHPAYCYPGTGRADETGTGKGVGTTLNLPMRPGADDDAYRATLTEAFIPAARSFQPDFLILSAGFDAHTRDPLAQIDVTDAGIAWMGEQVISLAESLCDGRLVAVLEGGYDLTALSTNVARLIEQLLAAGAD